MLQVQQNNYYYAQRIPSMFFYSHPKSISGTIPISLTLRHQYMCRCRQNTMAIKKSITIAEMPLHEKKTGRHSFVHKNLHIKSCIYQYLI